MIKRLLLGLLVLLLLLGAALVANTLRQGSRQVVVAALAPIEVDKAGVALSMATAVRARTVSGLLDPAAVAAAYVKQVVADQSYRFMPIRFKSADLQRVHGTDERIAVDPLADMVRFYHRLLTQATQ